MSFYTILYNNCFEYFFAFVLLLCFKNPKFSQVIFKPSSIQNQKPVRKMAPQHGFVDIETEITSEHNSITKAEKVLQQQLVLILHAHNCQIKEIMDTEHTYKCSLPYCHEMKQVINHIRGCAEREDCGFRHCNSSVELIAHYKSCRCKDCSICAPVRRMSHKNLQAN